jgi:hypothetical protein
MQDTSGMAFLDFVCRFNHQGLELATRLRDCPLKGQEDMSYDREEKRRL